MAQNDALSTGGMALTSRLPLAYDRSNGGGEPRIARSRAPRRVIVPRKPGEKGTLMKRLLGLAVSVSTLLLMTACDTALIVGNKTIGIRSGEFIYTDGFLRATYTSALDSVWNACEKTLADLKATEVTRLRKIATGDFTAVVQDEKVLISVEYVEKNLTAVSVRTGTAGNNLASQLIQDRIAGNLKKP